MSETGAVDGTEGEAAPKRRGGVVRFVRGAALGLAWIVGVLLWVVAGVCLFILAGRTVVPLIAVAVLAVLVLWKLPRAWWVLFFGILLMGAALAWRGSLRPRSDRVWMEELERMPLVTIEGDSVTIEGVRNFRWHESGGYDANWETRTYDLANLRGVELIVEPSSYSDLMAHTMLGFDFGPDGRLVLSIEARKEEGEQYGPVAGALNQYELIYLFLDERDAFGARAVQRGATLIAYPARTRREFLGPFFRKICASANGLRERPEFYHIIYHNCTTRWIRHVDAVNNTPFYLTLDTTVNGRIGRQLYREGVMDTDLSYDEAKERFRIDDRVREHFDDPDFSDLIRSPD